MMISVLMLLGLSVGAVVINVLIIVSFILYSKKFQWLASHNSIVEIKRDSQNVWALLYKGGKQDEGLMLMSCVVTQHFVMLNFHSSRFWKKKAITIMADSVDAELFRKLRVYCREANSFQR